MSACINQVNLCLIATHGTVYQWRNVLSVARSTELQGMHAASFILRGLCTGKDKGELLEELQGDAQLFDMWMVFLVHNHWVEKRMSKGKGVKWVMTVKGKEWVDRLERSLNEPLL